MFSCKVESIRCADHAKNGNRCKRRTVIGSPYCSTHLAYNHHLKIKTSNIPNAGKGLFAINPLKNADPNAVLFRNRQTIIRYNGEVIDAEELQARYGRYTAPYGLEVSEEGLPEEDRIYEDGACKRGCGNIANQANDVINNNSELTIHPREGWARLTATKNIKNGDEILCNYGGNYRYEAGVTHTTK